MNFKNVIPIFLLKKRPTKKILKILDGKIINLYKINQNYDCLIHIF